MKVLASDFDGTIFFKNHVKEADIKAVKTFQSKGHLFGLCTGRPLMGITKYVKDDLVFDFYILSTGAVILDKDLKAIYEKTISRKTVEAIVNKYENQTSIMIQADREIYSLTYKPHMEKEYLLESLEDLKTDNLFSVSLECLDEDIARALCMDIKDTFKDIDAFQNTRYIDVVPMGCSKGKGIALLKEYLKVNDIAAIGDSYNDIPMLDAVSDAFTFHESPDTVKKHANHYVDSVAEAIDILMNK